MVTGRLQRSLDDEVEPKVERSACERAEHEGEAGGQVGDDKDVHNGVEPIGEHSNSES